MRIAYALLAAGLVTAIGAGSVETAAPDAQPPPRPDIKVLADEPVSGNDAMHAVVGIANWPPGAMTMRHYHAGDEYATVLEGAIEIDNAGEAPRVYQAGQAYHNRRGVVHVAKNASNGPSKLSIVLIIDKGAPLQVPVQ
jgi:quercetin dioxygenase-like cupin family protein